MAGVISPTADISFEILGQPSDSAAIRIVWGHGWGQSRLAFRPFVESLQGQASHLLVDFPGFGASPPPPAAWGTAEYADFVAELISRHPKPAKTIWVGHSFGGRVGIQLAARHPDIVDGLFLIAAAGLKRNRSVVDKIRIASRIYVFKALKRVWLMLGKDINKMRTRFGSSDYKSSGELRDILIKVVNEDLSEVARQVQCPVWLIYGSRDTETPPEIGHRLAQLMPHATVTVLEGQDHYSLLGNGRHQVLKRLRKFLEV